MKNKKGFTLIELLAIIVILAVIAVITVPIILNVIENAKKGATVDSAHGYKDAIQKFYLTQLQDNYDYNIDGTYPVNNGKLGNYDINLSGTAPKSGYISITNKVISGCLQFDEYSVNITNGIVGTAEKQKCKELATITIERQTENEITVGDVVTISDDEIEEKFYVISSDNTKTTLLAKYNLLVGSKFDRGTFIEITSETEGYGLQNVNATGAIQSNMSSGIYNAVLPFSSGYYWENKTGENQKYEGDYDPHTDTNFPYVYDEDEPSCTIATYVKNYKSELANRGINIISARLLKYEEFNDYRLTYDMTRNSNYWLGSARDGSSVGISLDSDSRNNYTNNNGSGVRPVIEVPTNYFSE